MNNVEHLLSDGSDLRAFGVCGLLDLVDSLSGESNDEDSEEISFSCSNVLVSLDKRLPLSDKRSELVLSEIHTVKVGQTGSALDFFDTKLELSESLFIVLVQISE